VADDYELWDSGDGCQGGVPRLAFGDLQNLAPEK